MIDWMNPSDEVLEARRLGYEEGYERGYEAGYQTCRIDTILYSEITEPQVRKD